MIDEELLNYLAVRLYADDDDRRELSLLLPGYAYDLAKWRARQGDLEPLRKIVVARMWGDADIENFVGPPPPPPPWPKHVRKDLAQAKPFKEFGRRSRYETMQRIKRILVEERGFSRYGLSAKVVEIAARILAADEDNLRILLDRGL